MLLPLAIRAAVAADLAWIAFVAFAGPEYAAFVPTPTGQLAVIGAGTIVHEVKTAVAAAAKSVRRWRQGR